jgi:site-specific DNA recombinase
MCLATAATTPAPWIVGRVLETRVLIGLRERMMTPKIAAEAMRAYTQETNRLNRERRSSAESIRRELAESARAIAEIVRVIEQGGWHRALSDRLTELEGHNGHERHMTLFTAS